MRCNPADSQEIRTLPIRTLADVFAFAGRGFFQVVITSPSVEYGYGTGCYNVASTWVCQLETRWHVSEGEGSDPWEAWQAALRECAEREASDA